jgi:hypothetical protein
MSSKPCDFVPLLLDSWPKSTEAAVAPILLSLGRRISFSLPCAGILHEEAQVEMRKLVRDLLVVVAMLAVVPASTFAQRKDQDKRPPKERVKVITNDRKDTKPPQNSNRPKPDDRKKP